VSSTYFSETYTRSPIDGEDGWEIAVGFVLDCRNREHAIAQLRAYWGDLMGSLILCHESEVHSLGRQTPCHIVNEHTKES